MSNVIDPANANRRERMEERVMFASRFEQSIGERKRAHHKLRMGDMIGFRGHMQGALFYMRLARQWKPKNADVLQGL